ncbi:MAG: hypothetical protein JWO38_6087 [Gemmataceae bacterium]|nr:hypothetical protein [Gemmataceae bacterium]
MNVTVAALLGLTLAQAPAQEYHPFNQRSVKFPINYTQDPKTIRKVELYACKNGDQVWQLVAVAPPTQSAFAYTAPEDGRYWFHIVIEDLKGGKDPANLTTEPPAMKVLFDTKPPAVVFTSARRNGEEVVVEWKVDDLFPKDDATRVYFRPASAVEGWQEVSLLSLPPNSRTGVRFQAGTTGPVVVKVVGTDLAGNTGEGLKEIAAAGATQSTISLSPGTSTATAPTTPATTPLPTLPAPASGPASPAGAVIPPPDAIAPPAGPGPLGPLTPPGPVAPAVGPSTPPAPGNPAALTPGSVVPLAIAPTAPVTPPAAPVNPPMVAPTVVPSGPVVAPSSTPGSPQPVPTFDPRSSLTPAGASGLAPAPGSQPGGGPANPGPVVEMTRAQVINTTRFDLNFQVEQKGPSGISRVDLWVTRDDGRSWVWWSQHDGRETAVKVNLGTQTNTQPEGAYGFRIVPVSGAGLSEATPVAGDAPDIRVVVDVSAPVVRIFPAVSDPASPDALMIKWEATDRNFSDDPITLEWSEGPTGPWRPVATASGDGVMQVGTTAAVIARRLPNTGNYAWRVPTGLPPRVYLKVTARDAAGNTTEQVTQQPLLIDLMKPRAKITGIGMSAPLVRP